MATDIYYININFAAQTNLKEILNKLKPPKLIKRARLCRTQKVPQNLTVLRYIYETYCSEVFPLIYLLLDYVLLGVGSERRRRWGEMCKDPGG